jgi:hypothetical protein
MADSLLSEIDQALRADRAGALWTKYRKPLFAIAGALILATALSSAWQAYREAKGGALLVKLTEAQKLIDAGKPMEAAASFGDIAKGASGEFKDLALVWQGRALVMAGKKDEAVSAFKTAADNGGSLWADVACLRLAGLDAAAAQPCLSANESSPLASTRAEWAAANLWAKGDVAGAKSAIETLLKDKNISPDTASRLTQWLSVMNAATS